MYEQRTLTTHHETHGGGKTLFVAIYDTLLFECDKMSNGLEWTTNWKTLPTWIRAQYRVDHLRTVNLTVKWFWISLLNRLVKFMQVIIMFMSVKLCLKQRLRGCDRSFEWFNHIFSHFALLPTSYFPSHIYSGSTVAIRGKNVMCCVMSLALSISDTRTFPLLIIASSSYLNPITFRTKIWDC